MPPGETKRARERKRDWGPLAQTDKSDGEDLCNNIVTAASDGVIID